MRWLLSSITHVKLIPALGDLKAQFDIYSELVAVLSDSNIIVAQNKIRHKLCEMHRCQLK